jgi:hypothetical protein
MMLPSPKSPHARGQATVEFLYVVPILLILLLASLQFVFIYEAKQTLNYATFAGTRAGALNHGAMAAIQEGLISGMAPLFNHGEDLAALKAARQLASTELGNPLLASIKIVNPTETALAGFDSGSGIPNDNLMYRDPADLNGGMNVQDANLLKVSVTYCVRLGVPIVNRMIYSFAVGAPTTPEKADTYSSGAIAAADLLKVGTPGAVTGLCVDPSNTYPYRIPVTSEAVVRMQTPFRDPGAWTAP